MEQEVGRWSKLKLPLIVIGVVLVVLALWVGSWLWIDTHIVSSKPDQTNEVARGVFGDKFGAVNSLFSGLAFSGVIVTLLLQRRDIKRQAFVLERQQFEAGLFHLLDRYGKIVEQLDISGFSGRQAFQMFLDSMRFHSPQLNAFNALKPLTRPEVSSIVAEKGISDALRKKYSEAVLGPIEEVISKDGLGLIDQYKDESIEEHHRSIREAYIAAHLKSSDALSHYFRTVYHILRYIDDSPLIESTEKVRYVKLVGAQLSGVELVVLFYNSLIPATEVEGATLEFGNPALLGLLKRYSLTKHLNRNMLFHRTHYKVFESLSATY